MFHHRYGARATVRALTGLDFGLRIRVDFESTQQLMFTGTQKPSARELICDLVEDISSLRVYSYALREVFERAMSAIQLNAACGSWGFVRRASLDLAGLLVEARRRRLADGAKCLCLAGLATRIADLCAGEEVR